MLRLEIVMTACAVMIATFGLVEAVYKVCEGWRMKEGD